MKSLLFTILVSCVSSKFIIVYDQNIQIKHPEYFYTNSPHHVAVYSLPRNLSYLAHEKFLQNISSGIDDGVVFTFTRQWKHASLSGEMYNFGNLLPDYQTGLTVDDLFATSALCFRSTFLYKHTILNLIKSLFLRNVCLIADTSYCSQRLVQWLLQQLNTFTIDDSSLKVSVLTVSEDRVHLFEQFYNMKSMEVNLVVVLAPNRYFPVIYKHVIGFSLDTSIGVWLVPHFEHTFILRTDLRLRRLIYLHQEADEKIERFIHNGENLVGRLLDRYEISKHICRESNTEADHRNCVESHLFEEFVEDQSVRGHPMYFTVHERIYSSSGKVVHAVSRIEVTVSSLRLLVPNQVSLLRAVSAKSVKRKLRVVTITSPPFIFENRAFFEVTRAGCTRGLLCRKHVVDNTWEDTCCYGFGVTLFELVLQQLNIEVDIYIVKDGRYGAKSSGEWDGMMADLVDDKADLAMAALTINKERSRDVDFTTPYMQQNIGIITKPEAEVLTFFNWKFMDPLSVEVQIALWVMVFTMIIFSYFANNYIVSLRKSFKIRSTKCYSLLESFTYIGGVAMQRDLGGVNPSGWGARASSIVYAFGMVIFITTYTARLAALSLQEEEKEPFMGSQDPRMRNPTDQFKFGILKSSSYETFFNKSSVEIYRRMGQFMQPYNVDSTAEGFQNVKEGKIQAFMDDYFFLRWHTSNDDQCEVRVSEDPLGTSWIGFAARKNLLLLQSIDEVILRLKEDEKITDIHKTWFSHFCQPQFFVTKKRALDITYLGGIILALACTILFSAPLLYLECIYLRIIQQPVSEYVRRKLTGNSEEFDNTNISKC